MDQGKAKQERTTAKAAFTRALNGLKHALSAGRVIAPTVMKRYEVLKATWEIVQKKHEVYVGTLNLEEDKDVFEVEEWIDEIAERFNEVEGIVDHFCESAAKREREENIKREEEQKRQNLDALELKTLGLHQQQQVLKEQRSIHCKQICQRLSSVIDSGDAGPGVESILRNGLTEMKAAFQECKCIQEAMIQSANTDANFQWYHDLSEKCNQIEDACHRLVGESKSQSTKSNLKLNKLQFDRFSGKMRDYPRFKGEFTKHIKPLYSPMEEAFVLKTYLIPEVREEVEMYGEDADAIWQRLNEKYGDEGKMVDLIMSDIKKIKRKAERDADLLHLINTVQRANRDLKGLDREYELNNVTIVSMIEEKLPFDVEKDWLKIVTGEDRIAISRNKFPKLLEFLSSLKRRIEYKGADIRSTQSVQGTISHMDGSSALLGNGKRCIMHDGVTHETSDCKAFAGLTYDERMNKAMEKGLCFSCLKSSHRSVDCKERHKCSVNGCTRFHHPLLHELVDEVNANISHASTKGSCLLMLMEIVAGYVNGGRVVSLWDTGSTVSLITFRKAKELKLSGTDVLLHVTKVGGKMEKLKSAVYELPLIDTKGKTVVCQLYGIDRISTQIQGVSNEAVQEIFKNVDPGLVNRPTGEIDVLIGMEYAGYHPERLHVEGHLLILRNRFGICIGGYHPGLTETTEKVVKHVSVHLIQSGDIREFFDTEGLGIECEPKCGGCRCGTCPIGGKPYTMKEEHELKLIEDGLEHRGDHWVARYPWKRDPRELCNNYEAVERMLRSLEKRLQKSPENARQYSDQIDDMLTRNVARRVESAELKGYHGPIHYIGHHEVLKEASTTPCRIVFNSSANFKGQILNDFWAKGPTLINSLIGVLIRFRENKVAMTGDIRKMYHAVKIEGIDQHTHRFLWREMDTQISPHVYAMTSVSFGDRPAGNIAILALRKTVDMFSESPQVKDVINRNTYIDDVADSFISRDAALSIARQIDESIRRGGFEIKEWKLSCGSESKEYVAEKCVSDFGIGGRDDAVDNERILGMSWDRETDEFKYTARLNFSPKHRNIRTGPDIQLHQIPEAIPKNMTKRMILSQINSIWDPLGLAGPFILKAKILMKKLWMGEAKGLGWDEEISGSLSKEWINFFSELLQMQHVRFARCLTPERAVGDPILVQFSDGSEDAYGTCSYARWKLCDGTIESKLIMAKNRVTPIKTITAVRSELMGAVLSKRMAETIQKECRFKFAKRYFIVDSQIVHAMINRESYGFNTFVAVRIGEIQTTTDPSEWYWCDGRNNIADWNTRGAKSPLDLDHNSLWQTGPEFLKLPEEDWPLKHHECAIELPEELKPILNVEAVVTEDCIKIENISSYDKLIRVTARVLSIFRGKPSLRNMGYELSVQDIEDAEMFWIKKAQLSIRRSVEGGAMQRLAPRIDERDVLVVGSRISEWPETNCTNGLLPLLPYDHRISRLYVEKAHKEIHHIYRSVSATVSRVRTQFWITQLQRIAKSVIGKCVSCIKDRRKLLSQIMGPIPVERLKPSLPWRTTGVDYFGPFKLRGEVNKRTTGKSFGVIFNCFTSRAVHLEVASDYSMGGFMLVLRRFVSIRGYPSKFVSDPGTQLKAASRELFDLSQSIDKEMLVRFGASKGTEWDFTPANAPWQNGVTESLVKSVKRSILGVIGEQRLTFGEMQTVFYEAANLVNERPIGCHPTEPNEYLSPNHLLLGRATSRAPAGPFRELGGINRRFEHVQKIVDDYWRKWTSNYFPSFVVRQKWHTEHRNLEIGDLVMVQDSNVVRGEWKLALVTQIMPSKDGKVRRAEVAYKSPQEGRKYEGKPYVKVERPVQRLVVLMPACEQENEQRDQNED